MGGGEWRGGDAVGACTESLGTESGDVGADAETDHQLGRQAAKDEEQQEEEEEEAAKDEEQEEEEEEAAKDEEQQQEEEEAAKDEEQQQEEEEEEAAELVSSPEKHPRRLPPPMPRAFNMRAERRGGRLILTEGRVEQRPRREVFRASRAGGRLRLQFADACYRLRCVKPPAPDEVVGASVPAFADP